MTIRIKPCPSYITGMDFHELTSILVGDKNPPLRFIKMKITYRCNLRCVKCNYWKRDDRINATEMVNEDAKKLIASARELGCYRIKLSGGEVLIRQDLEELIAECSFYGMESSITTNGVLLDESRAQNLARSGLHHISISLDCGLPEVQDKIVGVEGAGRATIKAIRSALGHQPPATQLFPRVVIAIVVHSLSVPYLATTIRVLADMGITSIALIQLVRWHLSDSDDLEPDLRYVEDVIDEALEIASLYEMEVDYRFPVKPQSREVVSPETFYSENACYVPWYHLYIGADGKASPCCYLKRVSLGSTLERGLRAIWMSEAIKNFRQACFPPIEYDICRMCSHEVNNNKWIGSQLTFINSSA